MTQNPKQYKCRLFKSNYLKGQQILDIKQRKKETPAKRDNLLCRGCVAEKQRKLLDTSY
jgi:hypothetical protein